MDQWKGIKINASTGRVNKIILSYNNLQGEIPVSIKTFDGLIELDLRGNRVKGVIPEEICSLSLLEGLYLYDNEMEGENNNDGDGDDEMMMMMMMMRIIIIFFIMILMIMMIFLSIGC